MVCGLHFSIILVSPNCENKFLDLLSELFRYYHVTRIYHWPKAMKNHAYKYPSTYSDKIPITDKVVDLDRKGGVG